MATIDTISSCIKSVIWQEGDEDCGVGEPAIVVKQYADGLVELKQGVNEVLVNRSSLIALARELRRLEKEPQE
ncbi:MAG: hypothetical protein WA154_11100 [Moraxellaceae bacterium]